MEETATPTQRITVGVLGGMGPLATADFLRKLTEHTPVTAERDHLTVAVWSDPTIPDRTEALLGTGPDPLPALRAGVARLTALGAGVIAIPCNTAHAFLPALRLTTDATFLDMVRIAMADAVDRQVSGHRVCRVGLLATAGTRIAKLYDVAAEEAGVDLVHVSADVQREHVDPAIEAIKRGDLTAGAQGIRHAARQLLESGAQVVVAGCTEIPLVADAARDVLPFIDATDSLAAAAVRAARG